MGKDAVYTEVVAPVAVGARTWGGFRPSRNWHSGRSSSWIEVQIATCATQVCGTLRGTTKSDGSGHGSVVR